ncbi:ComF family protein [Candidatus Woesebacteria bacterium]|nr:ComF family protein [Candidatus Woesebacteria bacterium]
MLKLIWFFCKEFFVALIEIIFPEFCIGCSKIGNLLCWKCYETVEFLQFPIKLAKETQLNSVTICCAYSGLAKKIVHELKYKGVIAVGKTVAHILYFTTAPPNFDVISFVPIHQKKKNRRGFNQSEIIAKELAFLFQKPVAELLFKTIDTKSQMSLSQKKLRQKNISETIMINSKVTSKATKKYTSVLLVDDVYTSGTTLNYCAQILKEFGFKKIHGICFAHEN